jgi:hypothetical protein
VPESMVAKVSVMMMPMTEAEIDARPPAIAPVVIRVPIRIPIIAVAPTPAVAPMAMPPAPPVDLVEQGIVRCGTVRHRGEITDRRCAGSGPGSGGQPKDHGHQRANTQVAHLVFLPIMRCASPAGSS